MSTPAVPFSPPTGIMTAFDAFAVAPSNSNDLATVARALYVGNTGDITLDTPESTSILFSNVQAGSILPVMVKRVRATGTTATGIVALK